MKIDRADYCFNSKVVKVKFIEQWVGWYDVVYEIGTTISAKEFEDGYYYCSGHGHPIFDITDYVAKFTREDYLATIK